MTFCQKSEKCREFFPPVNLCVPWYLMQMIKMQEVAYSMSYKWKAIINPTNIQNNANSLKLCRGTHGSCILAHPLTLIQHRFTAAASRHHGPAFFIYINTLLLPLFFFLYSYLTRCFQGTYTAGLAAYSILPPHSTGSVGSNVSYYLDLTEANSTLNLIILANASIAIP